VTQWAVAPAYLAHSHARLIRLAQDLDFLLRRESSIFAFAHSLRSGRRPPAGARSLSFSRYPFVQKSLKLHTQAR
jgi:hypothetical protein